MTPPWLDALRTIVQPVVGALPALVVVLFAGLLALTGLACGSDRRAYALEYADRLVDLAAVVVGISSLKNIRTGSPDSGA